MTSGLIKCNCRSHCKVLKYIYGFFFNIAGSKPKKTKQVVGRHTWTKAEIQETKELFKKFFQNDRTPGLKALTKLLQQNKKEGGSIWKLGSDKVKKKYPG